jgi:hypothetical protein
MVKNKIFISQNGFFQTKLKDIKKKRERETQRGSRTPAVSRKLAGA